jgi:hypothetical protein
MHGRLGRVGYIGKIYITRIVVASLNIEQICTKVVKLKFCFKSNPSTPRLR